MGFLSVEPNGSDCKRKEVRIIKLVKGRCPFVNYVKFRISKKRAQKCP